MSSEERARRKLLKDLRSGTYSLVILNLLRREGPMHGYGIMAKIRGATNGVLSPSESTVYESLKQLERYKLIRSFWARPEGGGIPRKYYEITELGIRVLNEVNNEMASIIKVLSRVIYGG